MPKDNEVAVTVQGEVVLYEPAMFPELKWQDPLEATARFARRFGAAKDLDDLFAVMEGNSVQDFVGRRLEIQEVEWVAYQADDGVIPNGICLATDIDTGEVLEFATTSSACVLFIRQAQILNLLPVQVKVGESLTRSGRKALNLVRP